MADLTQSADMLIAGIRDAVGQEMLESLLPLIRKMTEAAGELERVLSGAVKPKVARPARMPKVQMPEVQKPKLTKLKRSSAVCPLTR